MDRRGFLKTAFATIGVIVFGKFIPKKEDNSYLLEKSEKVLSSNRDEISPDWTTKWDNSNSNPLEDIRATAKAIREDSGMRPTWYVCKEKKYYS